MEESTLLALFDQYAGMVYRIAYSYLRQCQDTEDAVQTVFLKLIEGKAKPEPGREKAFLIRLTVNHSKDILRLRKRRKTEVLEENTAFVCHEDREVFEAVMALPAKVRIAVYLHYVEGYTFPEIGSFLHIGASAVSMRIHRAKKMLQNLLRED